MLVIPAVKPVFILNYYNKTMTINKLYKIINDRQLKMPKNSYVASLFRQGKERIIQKVEEEAIELILAAKGKSRSRIIAETADLLFHVLVLLSLFNIQIEDIKNELEKRSTKSKPISL